MRVPGAILNITSIRNLLNLMFFYLPSPLLFCNTTSQSINFTAYVTSIKKAHFFDVVPYDLNVKIISV